MTTSHLSRPGFDVSWSLHVEGTGNPSLRVDLEVLGRDELYVSDRVWDYDAQGKRIDDPFGIYRYVVGSALRLVLAPAPLPLPILPRVTYPPLCSRVRSGETRKRSFHLGLPIDEYSSLERNVSAPSDTIHVERVELVLGYRLRTSLKDEPRAPAKEEGEKVGFIVHDLELVVDAQPIAALPVRRRSGPMTRFYLPSDPDGARNR